MKMPSIVTELPPQPAKHGARIFSVAGPLTAHEALCADGLPKLWDVPNPGEPFAGLTCYRIDATADKLPDTWLVSFRYAHPAETIKQVP